MLEIRDVAKSYGSGSTVTHALRSISFSIAERELVCVVGPSGCGKTTLLKCIAGLMRPDGTGRWRFSGCSRSCLPSSSSLIT